MSRYYDEKTPRCEACGWFGTGTFDRGENAGQTYERCGYYGYIFHKDTLENCEEFKTPRGVADYLDRMNKKTKSKKLNTL